MFHVFFHRSCSCSKSKVFAVEIFIKSHWINNLPRLKHITAQKENHFLQNQCGKPCGLGDKYP